MLVEYNESDLVLEQIHKYLESQGFTVEFERWDFWLYSQSKDVAGVVVYKSFEVYDMWKNKTMKSISHGLGKTTGQIYDEITGKKSELEQLKSKILHSRYMDTENQNPTAIELRTFGIQIFKWIDEIMKGE